ncbi:MAG: 50S ribosomal protein L35 [Aeriscardovia sp.]|nr:50S ribosomal protein L35 [Aeriscardovia sp.]MBQ9687797.1 50S ribosomal protein L35 [Aeriscardovia sp.]MBR2554278.1 50S ribosomal protein L35 [Aeriscardovia sp.]MBR3359424.1 50S ribosomal protein L35 [Aeriscardovia sp.]MBR4414313.1 50S ribosomal protein L35 [Aeriscardovia sp.]
MPKMKTKTAAAKRIRVTGSGKLMACGTGMRHHLEHKSAHKRRSLSRDQYIASNEFKKMSNLLGR